MTFVIFFLLIIFILYAYQRYMKIVESVAHIPGPKPIPFFGNAFMFFGKTSTDLMEFGKEHVKKYGVFNRILLGPKILIALGHPKDIESLLCHAKSVQKSEEYEYTKDWIGEGLITSSGEKWFQRRKAITPGFHFSILQSFVGIFDKNANILVGKLAKFDAVDIFPLSLLCALDNICEAAMGTKINAQSNSDSSYVKAVSKITGIITKRHFLLPLRSDFIFKLSGLHAEQEKLLKIIHGLTDSVIIKRREKLNQQIETLTNDEEAKGKCALIDILLRTSINGLPLSNMDIREEVNTFMFAGHDTSASAIAFSFYNIAKHPECQQKVFKEIKSVLGDVTDPLTLKDLNNLTYLELVVKETLRMYPSVPFIGRKIKEDSMINGKMLPKGANVVISPLFMGMNEEIWNNASKFMPERFELDYLTNLCPFSYLPFSAGPRNCIGQKFAMLEIKCTIAKVLQNYEIALEPDFKVTLMPEIVLKPANGIKLRLKVRK